MKVLIIYISILIEFIKTILRGKTRMRLLMFYAPSFWYRTYKKVLEDLPDCNKEETAQDSVVVLYHAEEEDTAKKSSVITKFIKNVKWLSGKFNTRNIVLHSFGHLSTSKAPPDFTADMMEEVKKRLLNAGFNITETPFGYLNEWKIHVAGESLAKVFKEF